MKGGKEMSKKKMNKKKVNIPKEKKKKCNAIIHGATVATAGVGAGIAQIPLADNAVITPIQIAMIVALGKVFDVELSKSAATAILSGMSASFVGRGVSQALIGWIPGIGNAINAATAAGVTEAVGWIVAENFSKNAYDDIIRDNPMTDEERKEREEEKEKKQNERESLMKGAELFFSGTKNRKDDKTEYDQLLNKFEKYINSFPDDEEILTKYENLSDLR